MSQYLLKPQLSECDCWPLAAVFVFLSIHFFNPAAAAQEEAQCLLLLLLRTLVCCVKSCSSQRLRSYSFGFFFHGFKQLPLICLISPGLDYRLEGFNLTVQQWELAVNVRYNPKCVRWFRGNANCMSQFGHRTQTRHQTDWVSATRRKFGFLNPQVFFFLFSIFLLLFCVFSLVRVWPFAAISASFPCVASIKFNPV